MSILEVLEAATGFLHKHGVENPRLNAQHLLAATLQCRRMDLYLLFDRPVSEAERAQLRDLVRRRARGEPLQHLLGEWDFYLRTFHIDGRALIPRPETELLVEEILKRLPARDPLAIADVGTGSGVIGITLALERPAWKISATDISPDALALAEQNKARHACTNLSLSCCDLLPETGEEFDAIVANLPYVPTSELPNLPIEVQHDPTLALDGGPDGLAIIRRLLDIAPQRLHSDGWIFLEFGSGQSDALRAAFESTHAFTKLEILPDLAGIPRFAVARRA